MLQPTGTAVGTVTMASPDRFWRATRWTVGTRIRFHETEWRQHYDQQIVVVDSVTDDWWDAGDADRWIDARVQGRHKAGFRVVAAQTNGSIGCRLPD